MNPPLPSDPEIWELPLPQEAANVGDGHAPDNGAFVWGEPLLLLGD